MDAVLHEIGREEAHKLLTMPASDPILVGTTRFYAGYANGKLCCVAGVCTGSLFGRDAYLWMHHDEKVLQSSKVTFLRMAKKWVKDLPYDTIHGHALRGSSRWIEWLGAELDEPEGELIPFQIRKH